MKLEGGGRKRRGRERVGVKEGGYMKMKHGCTCRRGVCPGVLVSGGRPGEI